MSDTSLMVNANLESAGGAPAAVAPFADRYIRSLPVEAGYDEWAATYDLVPNPLLALEARLLLPRLARCRQKDVLDLCCGTGRWLEKLVEIGARSVTGIDLSGSMLRVASSKPALTGRLVRANCERLPIRSRFAHVIVCSFALSHLVDIAAFAEGLARVARPNAEIFITDLHPDAFACGWRTRFRGNQGTVEIASAPRSLEQLTRTLRAHGLHLTALEEPALGEPERPIFSECGKDGLFETACAIHAIFIAVYRASYRFVPEKAT